MSRDEAATHSQVLYYRSIDDSDWNTSVMLCERLHTSLETDMEEKLKHRRNVARTLALPFYDTMTLAASKSYDVFALAASLEGLGEGSS